MYFYPTGGALRQPCGGRASLRKGASGRLLGVLHHRRLPGHCQDFEPGGLLRLHAQQLLSNKEWEKCYEALECSARHVIAVFIWLNR